MTNYTPEQFGALGDGVTDDTAPIQQALDALLTTADTLTFSPTKVYLHSGVLRARKTGRITGGTLIATNEASSSFQITAPNVTLTKMTLMARATTRRWDAAEQMKLYIAKTASNVNVSSVTIDGSAAAGVYVGGTNGFVLADVIVQNTRADAIHITGGASNGKVARPIVKNPGDDGVAVVSYNTAVPCSNIQVVSPRLYGQKWGRGFSVVGGTGITYTDVYSDGSGCAAIYIAAESEWNSHPCKNIVFDGGRLINSNTVTAVDHGAVLIYNSQAGQVNSDITIKNLTIKDTRVDTSRQTGLVQYNGGTSVRVTMDKIRILGGNKWLFSGNAPASATRRTGWTWNGAAVPDALGW